MGFYDDQILPRLTNVLLSNRELGKIRARVASGLSGEVLEIGFGSGSMSPSTQQRCVGYWQLTRRQWAEGWRRNGSRSAAYLSNTWVWTEQASRWTPKASTMS